VIFYDSARHQETLTVSDQLAGNSPLIVDRVDASVHETGTAEPVEKYLADYVAGRRLH
jgi:hypothetical protein